MLFYNALNFIKLRSSKKLQPSLYFQPSNHSAMTSADSVWWQNKKMFKAYLYFQKKVFSYIFWVCLQVTSKCPRRFFEYQPIVKCCTGHCSDAKRSESVLGERANEVFQVWLFHNGAGNYWKSMRKTIIFLAVS